MQRDRRQGRGGRGSRRLPRRRAAPSPRALLIDGEPGIGKTTLLQRAAAIARRAGLRDPVAPPDPVRDGPVLRRAGRAAAGHRRADPRRPARPAGPRAADGPAQGGAGRAVRPALAQRRRGGGAAGGRRDPAGAARRGRRPVARSIRPPASWPSPCAVWPARRRASRSCAASGGWSAPDGAGRATAEDRGRLARTSWPARCPPGGSTRSALGPIGPSGLSRILRRVLGWVPRVAPGGADRGAFGRQPVVRHRARPGRSAAPVRTRTWTRSLPDSMVELARSRIARLPDRVREAVELASVPRAPTLDLLRRLRLGRRSTCATRWTGGPQRHRDDRRGPDPVRPPDPGRGRVRVDPDRPPAGAAPRRRHALRRPGGARPSPGQRRPTGRTRTSRSPCEGAAEQAWRRGAPDAAADLLRLACRLTPPARGRGAGAAPHRLRPAAAQRRRRAGRHRRARVAGGDASRPA